MAIIPTAATARQTAGPDLKSAERLVLLRHWGRLGAKRRGNLPPKYQRLLDELAVRVRP